MCCLEAVYTRVYDDSSIMDNTAMRNMHVRAIQYKLYGQEAFTFDSIHVM